MNRFEKFLEDNDIDEAFIMCAVNMSCYTCPLQFMYTDECMNHRKEINAYLRKEVKHDN